MVKFSETAQKYLDEKYGTSDEVKFLVSLSMGGCYGTYFNLEKFPTGKHEEDYVKIEADKFSVFTPIDQAKVVAPAEIKIDYIDDFGFSFMAVKAKGDQINSCACGKSVICDNTEEMDVQYNYNGMIESFCQPID